MLVPVLSFGQLSPIERTEPTGEPEIHYYNFYNDVQMVEFDYLSAYHRKVNYLEQAQPRALTWDMVLGPPHPNVYIFRDKSGKILKQFGSLDSAKLLSVEESLTKTESHNSFKSNLGSSLGFSRISTRYFPYYLLGTMDRNSPRDLGLIDSLGNVVLKQEYHIIWQGDNNFIAIKGDTNELRDLKLKLVFSTTEYNLQPSQSNSGYVDIIKDEKMGLMNSAGKIIVPCEYKMLVGSFNDLGLARVEKNGKVGFVNRNGDLVIKCKYENAGDFKDGLLNVRINDKWGYIDVRGKTIIQPKYEIGISFVDGIARVARREGSLFYFGFIDVKGNEIIPLIYSKAEDFENGFARVMINDKWIKIDKNGVEQK
jgi:hypothetical protein